MELKINQCERYDSTGMIYKVAYQFYIDANDGTRTSHYGVSSFEGDPTSPTYVEVSDITEENVKTWVKSQLGEEKIERIRAQLQLKVDNMNDPENFRVEDQHVVVGLPWN